LVNAAAAAAANDGNDNEGSEADEAALLQVISRVCAPTFTSSADCEPTS